MLHLRPKWKNHLGHIRKVMWICINPAQGVILLKDANGLGEAAATSGARIFEDIPFFLRASICSWESCCCEVYPSALRPLVSYPLAFRPLAFWVGDRLLVEEFVLQFLSLN
jgi:hypothetical protein